MKRKPIKLYREAAIADGTDDRLRVSMSVLVENGRVAWMGEESECPSVDKGETEVIDASGCTIIPGMVDAHSHLTLPGGAHHIERGLDETESLLDCAERNAELQMNAGIRWARDVGAPTREDPRDGSWRALTIGLKDRWRGSTRHPYIRAAGTWLSSEGYLPAGLPVHVSDADELVEAAKKQLDDGADFVKLMLDGPLPGACPWSVSELRRVVEVAHKRGSRVTAHSTHLEGARMGVSAGVDSIEHGFELDTDTCELMASNGTFLVATLTALKSREAYPLTTQVARYVDPTFPQQLAEQLETAAHSVAVARKAGVTIAAGTDFGGGSARANQLAWEVESLVEAGLEPWEALRSVTRNGGDLLNEPDAGNLHVGGPADFFLVHGDPLSDPGALWRVWRVAWLD